MAEGKGLPSNRLWTAGFAAVRFHPRRLALALDPLERRPSRASKFEAEAHPDALDAGKSGRRVVSDLVTTAFAQNDAESARQQWRRVADQLRSKVPKLATLMDETEPDVLAYMTFPTQHRAKLRSTNPLERFNGDIKRRTEVVGIFPNEAAITRLAGAILLEQNDSRYVTLETIAAIPDDPINGLTAMAG